MAVSMNVDYTRQLYTGLSTDDWGEISPNEGDVVYIMDLSECYIYDGSTMHQLPDLGGGGGGGSTIVSKTITANGTYYASSDSADGYNPVIVNVPNQYENFVFLLYNALGGQVSFVSTFYDSDLGRLRTFIYAAQNPGAQVQKTCILQNGMVELGLVTNRDVGSVTYQGTPLNATITGSGSRRYIEFEVPDPFDPTIPIYFNA